MNVKPRLYQKSGVRYLSRRSAILGDQVGLGKTATSLWAAEEIEARSILVIVPANLRQQWAEEIIKIHGHRYNVRLVGKAGNEVTFERFNDALPMAPTYYITHYEQYRDDRRDKNQPHIVGSWALSNTWDLVIVDECHRLKNKDSQQGQWIRRLQAKQRWGLTGTPIADRPQDMWGLLNWIDPKRYRWKGPWLRKYMIFGYNGYGHKPVAVKQDQLPALAEEVRPYIYVRTLDDVGLELPPLTIQDVPLTMPDRQANHYKKVKTQAMVDLSEVVGDNDDLLDLTGERRHLILTSAAERFTRLHQIASDPTDPKAGNARLPSAKMDWLKGYVQDGGPPAVVLTRYRHTAETIRKNLKAWGAEGFIVGTWAYLSEGHNLQHLHTMILWDLTYELLQYTQGLGRCHRSGQTKPVHVYRLCLKGTVDTRIKRTIDKKDDQSQLVLGWLRGLLISL